MKKKILVYIHYLEIGGAERALLGLLSALDPQMADVDLLVNQQTGPFMSLVPEHVRLIPQMPEYSAIERPIREIVIHGHFSIAARRIAAKCSHWWHTHTHRLDKGKTDESIFQYVFSAVTPALRDLRNLGHYDLAISFLHPHNIVLQKVSASRKVCWVHTDYSSVYLNRELELPVWSGFDKIFAVSESSAEAFAALFPEIAGQVSVMENILNPNMIRKQALVIDVEREMKCVPGQYRLLSVGRYCTAKRFEEVPKICRMMLDMGINFKWYIIGYGNDAAIRANIEKYDVARTLVLLGKRDNPYPYIKACDVYVQPSLYEGKSVTVREAQILCRPVVVTAYPSASSQIADGIDGRIVPMAVEECAAGIADFLCDTPLRRSIADYLQAHDYGTEGEVKKLYDLMK